MKVNEIIAEERLDEALPLIAGIAVPAILTAISAFLAGLTIMDAYKLISKYNEDPASVTDDQWDNLFIDVALLAVPALGRLGRPIIVKMIPNKLKSMGGKWIRDKVQAKLSKDIAKSDAKYGAAARAGKSPEVAKAMRAKNIAAIKTAKEVAAKRAATALAKLKDDAIFNRIGKYFGIGVATAFVAKYWNTIADIEEQIKLRNGDPENLETPLFKDMEKSAANAKAQELKNKAVGELTLAIGAALAGAAVAKKVEFFGELFGRALPGGKYVKGIFTVPANVTAAIIRMSGPGLAMFMQTDSGRKLLETQAVQAITSTVGSVVNSGLDLIVSGAEIVANMMGIDISKQTDKLKSNIQDPMTNQTPMAAHKDPYGLAVTTDPKNPKVKMVGGHIVTDATTGYLLNNIPGLLSRLKEKAAAFKVPNPIDTLEKDPKKQYSV